ncbi:MerR family transcriptional regulator [Paenibacillus sp. J5C_2022]|uniref:MerR family transcriptional regulator n=1 Tax=Paenibacillus sp. J5C2022 TaxID=2977129 RepID=UPI0021CF0BE9|nr:MerR family transcriptional regulator [Paenibacillus sp. J5C2022]MCU6708305.1 MerR family transcriptional regulator [Paenibacillus sp. J5C2022]
MRVHEAAAKVGASPRALRFYEEKGLIAPVKQDNNGYRIYKDTDVDRLRWIVALRELGLSIAQIKNALASIDKPSAFLEKVDAARGKLYEEWLAASQMLRAFDETLARWHQKENISLDEAEAAAENIRSIRSLRDKWSDKWDFDGIARQYGTHAPLTVLQHFISPSAYDAALAQTLEWLDPQMEEKGLELGAGSGNLTMLLAESGAQLTIVEQSVGMLAILRQRVPQVTARRGNMLSLPVASSHYNFIATSFAMQYLDRQQQLLALQEMDRVLLVGGRLVISGLMAIESGSQQADKPKSPNHEEAAHAITPSTLSELTGWLKQHHYDVVSRHITESIHIIIAVKM